MESQGTNRKVTKTVLPSNNTLQSSPGLGGKDYITVASSSYIFALPTP